MILMEFLFAPTVPSEPRPKKTQRTVFSLAMEKHSSYGQAGVGDIVIDTDGEMVLG